MYSGAMRFKHLASSYYLKALHTASAVRMRASKGKKDTLMLCVCGMCTLCLDLFCKAVKNISVYLHMYYLCVGYFSITLCSVRLMTLSPAINELGFAIAEIVDSYPFWTLFCTPNIQFRPWKHYLVRHIFSFLSVLSFSFVLYYVKCWLMRELKINTSVKV